MRCVLWLICSILPSVNYNVLSGESGRGQSLAHNQAFERIKIHKLIPTNPSRRETSPWGPLHDGKALIFSNILMSVCYLRFSWCCQPLQTYGSNWFVLTITVTSTHFSTLRMRHICYKFVDRQGPVKTYLKNIHFFFSAPLHPLGFLSLVVACCPRSGSLKVIHMVRCIDFYQEYIVTKYFLSLLAHFYSGNSSQLSEGFGELLLIF